MCLEKTGFLFLQGKHNTGFYEKLPKDQTNLWICTLPNCIFLFFFFIDYNWPKNERKQVDKLSRAAGVRCVWAVRAASSKHWQAIKCLFLCVWRASWDKQLLLRARWMQQTPHNSVGVSLMHDRDFKSKTISQGCTVLWNSLFYWICQWNTWRRLN